jgi:hypothetical protein
MPQLRKTVTAVYAKSYLGIVINPNLPFGAVRDVPDPNAPKELIFTAPKPKRASEPKPVRHTTRPRRRK